MDAEPYTAPTHKGARTTRPGLGFGCLAGARWRGYTCAGFRHEIDDVAERLLNIDQLVDFTGLSRTSLYRLQARGMLPASWKVKGSVYWVEGEVREWLLAVPQAMNEIKSARDRLTSGFTAAEVTRTLKLGDRRTPINRLALERLAHEGVLKRRRVRSGGRPRVEFVPKP